MKSFINIYILFSILISTTFSNLLIAKIAEGNDFYKICTYEGSKILLPNGKLIDENNLHEECEVCINCFPDTSFSFFILNNSKNILNIKYLENCSKLIFSKNTLINTIRGPPIN